ncbi:MAG: DNA translocase FtsK 4TM domain-containing protein [Gammaproteobacteria bacterium]|nr:DNA translocase FtsK 4TM domain-containing protein [Gammaproteobacteria bacterium]
MIYSLREGGLLLVMSLCLYLLLSLVSFSLHDPGWSHTGKVVELHNLGGRVGAWFADILLYLFGYMAYCLPFIMGYIGWMLLRSQADQAAPSFWFSLRFIGFLLLFVTGAALASMHFIPAQGSVPLGVFAGGLLGDALSEWLVVGVSAVGATLFLLAFFLANISFCFGFSWLKIIDRVGALSLQGIEALQQQVQQKWNEHNEAAEARSEVDSPLVIEASQETPLPVKKRVRQEPLLSDLPSTELARTPPLDQSTTKVPEPEGVVEAEVEGVPPVAEVEVPDETQKQAVVMLAPQEELPEEVLPEQPLPDSAVPKVAKMVVPLPVLESGDDVSLPPLSLLDEAVVETRGYSEETLEEMSRLLELRLADYKVTADVVEVHPGPVITRFELALSPGIKASKVSSLAKDLARSLSISSVRVVESISGKSTIGLEIPNEQREMVRLREIVGSEPYAKSESPLTLALGKGISGQAVVADLAKMPHLLVAGTTGSGKSVAVNAMLISLLYKSSPNDVRMILIDPKMLELNVYEGIPHLLTPVVTDMKEAANALRWSVAEMERRYRLMASLGVRNIVGYNRKVTEAIEAGEPLKDPTYKRSEAFDPAAPIPFLENLPYIVVVVDEFADMMMVVGKKAEELITRIAQKARAAGIHLILATQRPSVDVITGLIKANVPTRIAFQVSSRIDSRTILDQGGAEHLLGHGDMLYLPPGMAHPIRVHGAFVDDHEVHNVVKHLKSMGKANYIDEILQEPISSSASLGSDGEQDELYDQAVAIVTETRNASVSSVQRRLRIGYNRASRLVEEMEASGVVSSNPERGVREVLAPAPPKE